MFLTLSALPPPAAIEADPGSVVVPTSGASIFLLSTTFYASAAVLYPVETRVGRGPVPSVRELTTVEQLRPISSYF